MFTSKISLEVVIIECRESTLNSNIVGNTCQAMPHHYTTFDKYTKSWFGLDYDDDICFQYLVTPAAETFIYNRSD